MSLASEGKRILLVEDDPSVRELIHAQLPQHDIHSAAHREAAYQALDSGAYDLVLLDLRLPVDERDIRPNSEVGFEILGTIRGQSRLDKTAVVVMTAYEGTSETTKRALKSGATDYWNKDRSYQEDLFDLVDRVLGEQEMERRQVSEEAATRLHRLEFCEARGQVRLDGLVIFKKTSFRLLAALRCPFVAALAGGESPRFLMSSELTRMLSIDDGYLRITVKRIRDRASKSLQDKYGLLPALDVIIQSQQWDGYRLNPRRLQVVDVTASVDGPQ